MSGIAGIIHFDRMPVQAGQIERMTAAMAHRGPDGLAHWQEGSAAFGHCLLRTTSESTDESQPLVDRDPSLVLVFDGRIDNALELTRELRVSGATLRTRADSELVLRAYERWGPALLDHLDGDFAFAIWDPQQRKLFCARDRIGAKPFHYLWNGTTFAFASDVSALLALPWVDKQLNLGFIAEVLASEWMSLEDTYWNGIQRLPPAHRLIVSAEGFSKSRYWQPRLEVSLPCRTTDEYAEYYKELLFDVVRRMGRSSGPVACEVSGGLDSSALFAVAVDLQRRGDWPAPDVHGYTLDFRGAGVADEMDYAEAVARHVGKEVVAIAPTRQPLSWYAHWASQHGYPAGYPNGVMGLGIREAARDRGSNCLLVGVGGDEWVDGYPCYYADAIAARNWPELLRLFRTDGRDVGIPTACWWVARYGVGPILPTGMKHAIRAGMRRAQRADGWLTPQMRRRLLQRRPPSPEPGVKGMRVSQRSQLARIDDAFSLLARESEERLGASTGIEVRRPLWDRRLVEFALATPESLRASGRNSKMLHRLAMTGLLPESVRRRETKAEFGVTFRWSASELRSYLAETTPTLRDWVTPGALAHALQGRGDPDWPLWSLFGCHNLRQISENQ